VSDVSFTGDPKYWAKPGTQCLFFISNHQSEQSCGVTYSNYDN